MSAGEWVQIALIGVMFPFAGFFFRKNERLHEVTQAALHVQDLKVATMELQIAVLYNHLKIPMPQSVHSG